MKKTTDNSVKTLVVIPTYNEKENIQKLSGDVYALKLKNLDLLVIDDASPDNTGQLLEKLRKKYLFLYVMHRKGELGIGSAHKDGINWAYNKGYKALITMDADLTHDPKYIPEIIKHSVKHDLVITSRYMKGGGLEKRSYIRNLMTKMGHLFIIILFRFNYDASNSFRLYKLERIPKKLFDKVESKGYSFFFESLFILNLNKVKIKEISIKLNTRYKGTTKLNASDTIASFKYLLSLYF